MPVYIYGSLCARNRNVSIHSSVYMLVTNKLLSALLLKTLLLLPLPTHHPTLSISTQRPHQACEQHKCQVQTRLNLHGL